MAGNFLCGVFNYLVCYLHIVQIINFSNYKDLKCFYYSPKISIYVCSFEYMYIIHTVFNVLYYTAIAMYL